MNMYVQLVAISNLIISSSLFAVTLKELLEEKEEKIAILRQYWIDKDGNTHIGNKDRTVLEFAFNRTLLNNMNDTQLRNAMNAALMHLTNEQQEKFKSIVNPELDALRDIKQQLLDMRKKMNDTAIALGNMIGKTQQDVMRLPDQNLKNIISVIADSVTKLKAYNLFITFAELRKEFAPEAIASVGGTSKQTSFEEKEEDDSSLYE